MAKKDPQCPTCGSFLNSQGTCLTCRYKEETKGTGKRGPTKPR